MGWLYELVAVLITFCVPLFQYIGVPNVYFIDSITFFVIIPFFHLMNDDDTKKIIFYENFYQGIRYTLGMYIKSECPKIPYVAKPIPQECGGAPAEDNLRHESPQILHSSPIATSYQRCSSAPNCNLSRKNCLDIVPEPLYKYNSLRDIALK